MQEKGQIERSVRENVWAVVLAAGEGSRMAPLTRKLYGYNLPKQFAAFAGDRSFLQRTLDRIAPLVPPERTVVVVSAEYETMARAQVRGYEGLTLVGQPQNVGTGPGILLPLAHVLSQDLTARVVVFPSDHHIRRDEVFGDAVRRAVDVSGRVPSSLALVGAVADQPDTGLGWIVPSAGADPASAAPVLVDRFVEKPALPMARSLLEGGALWNTMVMAASAAGLWRLLRRYLPTQTRAMDRYLLQIGRGDERKVRERTYRALSPADFSREVLQRATGLGVVAMADSGWSDCGTPESLFECWAGTKELERLRGRLGDGELAGILAGRKGVHAIA